MTEQSTPPSQHPGAPGKTGDVVPPVNEYVEYHWGRIFFAAALVVALGAGAVYGIQALMGGAEDITLAPVDSAAEAQPLLEVEIAEAEAEELPVVTVPTGSRAELLPPSDSPTQADAGDVEPVSSVAGGESESPMATDGEAVAEPPLVEPEPAMMSASAQVELLAPGLVRAQLTWELEDKEPVDVLPHQLVMNEEGPLRVFLFTETEGLKNQVHFHEWYLNDERVARVRILPYSDHMRASSSKFIGRGMTGDWRVDVVLASGERLATGTFVVLPPALLED
ncbi:DUF2914 domain-containing protein [Marinobacter zhejiangensis]|uniref:DUF2914 domain-containing protein n=1 Tax=Marinobacter zhejiangensis TaxID=488535 RepID=A0A1I4PZW5_9GAMM|nr:DUF2914 domain-containing protein [Marinobacter zhejiangensis]SFM33284.1 Protein of unknown function [Marinobacter zhejiangensis]